MQEYDVTLKLLLTGSADVAMRLLGVSRPVSRWLNVELPKVQNQRVDLLAELAPGQLLQIELQNRNLVEMPVRMLEYGAGIWRVQGAFPRQIVLYVGNDRLSMPNEFRSSGLAYRFDLIDIRDLDGEALLARDCISDNVLAALTALKDKGAAIRRIIARIAKLEEPKRKDALQKLLILCGMRGMVEVCRQEEKNMPIDLDIRDHEFFGPPIRKAERENTQHIIRLLLEERFGRLPAWVDQRISASSQTEAEDLARKFVHTRSLEELFS